MLGFDFQYQVRVGVNPYESGVIPGLYATGALRVVRHYGGKIPSSDPLRRLLLECLEVEKVDGVLSEPGYYWLFFPLLATAELSRHAGSFLCFGT